MKYCRAAMLHYILLGVAANTIETEPGFPTVCGNPTVQREHKAEAQRTKTPATPHSWPWHVGLWTTRLGGRPFCGGTLISNFLVVTAAHCIFSSPGLHKFPLGKLTDIEAASGVRFHVLVGTHDYTREDTAYQLRLVHYAMVHPHYNDTILGKGYDIALLKLHENIIPDERVRPICFPSTRVSVRQGSTCYYAGWGGFYPTWSKDTLVYPTTLREAEVQIDFDENCAKFFGPPFTRQQSMHKNGRHESLLWRQRRWNILSFGG
ncbi:hypothetical protein AAHC03_019163 [Spirometra sp. Aus1]